MAYNWPEASKIGEIQYGVPFRTVRRRRLDERKWILRYENSIIYAFYSFQLLSVASTFDLQILHLFSLLRNYFDERYIFPQPRLQRLPPQDLTHSLIGQAVCLKIFKTVLLIL